MIHGLGDSAIHTYAPRFAASSLRNTPSLFIDLPGFGSSTAAAKYPGTIEAMADDVALLLSYLQVSNAPLFAHSMGANISIELCSRYPKLAHQLILADPLLHPAQSILAARIARFSESAFASRGFSMLVRATSLQAHRGEEAAAAFLPTLKQANPLSLYRAAISLMRDREPTFEELLRQLPHPITMLIGQRSPMQPARPPRADIRVRRVANAGHFVMAEAAESTACAILETIGKLQQGGNERQAM